MPLSSLSLPSPGALSLGNICSRPASHRRNAAGLVHFMLCENGRLKSPPGILHCHQRLASALLPIRHQKITSARRLPREVLCVITHTDAWPEKHDRRHIFEQTMHLYAYSRTVVRPPMYGLTYFPPVYIYMTRACGFPSGTMAVLYGGGALTVVTD